MASRDYGKVIRPYCAKGKVKLKNDDEFPCQITIQQIETGLIHITCQFTSEVALTASATQYIMNSSGRGIGHVYGKTKDRLSFKSQGELLIRHAKFELFSNKSSEITLLAQKVNFWSENKCHAGCYKFSVVNFEFTGNHPVKRIIQDGPKQVELLYENLELKTPWGIATVDPVPDYGDLIMKTKAQKGISVTCEVVAKPSVNMELREISSKLDELCCLLSLARGTKITWINTEECREDGKAHRIILRNPVTWPFSSLPLIDPRNSQDTAIFIEKVYPTYLKLRDSYNLNIAIEQYLDAKREVVYLETRALVAVSLLDSLLGQYASLHNLDKIVSNFSSEKKRKLRTNLKECLMKLFPYIDGSSLNEMAEKVSELNRRSYLNLLVLWARDLKLDMSQDELSRVKDTRHSLVHGAKFLSSGSTGKTREYFRVIQLIDQVFLKLLGYDGWFMGINLDTLRFEGRIFSHNAFTEQLNIE
ncbi:hypothetical protein ES707_21234 [subsurface metagenome]